MGDSGHYERNVKAAQTVIARGPAVITELLAHSNYAWAAQNCKILAEAFVDLGLLYWRQGTDPRREFEAAEGAYLKLVDIVRKHRLPKGDFDVHLVYAAMFLIGRKTEIVFCDEETNGASRWACYQARLVHALHDAPASDALVALTDRHLAENDKLPDDIFEIYFQLLGLRPSKLELEERVRRAKSTWAERKRSEDIPEGRALDGVGAMNEIYVDIYLGAVLRKIGWKGRTVHAWQWD